jgi:competence ComEA-like helix-hairpin-helix protein
MLIAARSLTLLLVAVAACTPPDATAQPAEKPALRSTVPTQLDAPRDHPSARPRAVERAAVDVKDKEKEKININSADVKQLMGLPGVTRKVAERIVAYRDTHGPFKKPSELRKVDGVDEGLWEKNRARIVVR